MTITFYLNDPYRIDWYRLVNSVVGMQQNLFHQSKLSKQTWRGMANCVEY